MIDYCRRKWYRNQRRRTSNQNEDRLDLEYAHLEKIGKSSFEKSPDVVCCQFGRCLFHELQVPQSDGDSSSPEEPGVGDSSSPEEVVLDDGASSSESEQDTSEDERESCNESAGPDSEDVGLSSSVQYTLLDLLGRIGEHLSTDLEEGVNTGAKNRSNIVVIV
jgi:hypothetical protein